jgi:CheY-like chemotaxis protein
MGMMCHLDVLLIEDNRTQALQFQLLIQRFAGFHVHVASDGVVGWRKACSELPRLIFLDINLPAMDGFQVLTRLKRNRATSNIPVVMLTASQGDGDVARAVSLGADGYLVKEETLYGSGMQICDTLGKFLCAS